MTGRTCMQAQGAVSSLQLEASGPIFRIPYQPKLLSQELTCLTQPVCMYRGVTKWPPSIV
eukprot:1159696-Pelagomonas_calceolata.AAC.11